MIFNRDDRAPEPGEYATAWAICTCGAVVSYTSDSSTRGSAIVSHRVAGDDTPCPDATRKAPTS